MIYSQFNDSKYTKWYFNIINHRILNPIIEPAYFEKHHILPKSMGGSLGANLVNLTAREHFICHLLLVRMTNGEDKNNMIRASFLMSCVSNIKINSKTYAYLRRDYKKLCSEKFKGEGNPNYGKVGAWTGKHHSIETKLKLSKANKGQKRSPETCLKFSIAAKNKKIDPEVARIRNEKISKANSGINNPNYGKKLSLETIEKMKGPRPQIQGKNSHLYGKPSWILGKHHHPSVVQKFKSSMFKLWHIQDTIANETIYYYGSLRDVMADIGLPKHRVGLLQRTLKSQIPISSGPLKGLQLVDCFKI
jgi:hypothetical protein